LKSWFSVATLHSLSYAGLKVKKLFTFDRRQQSGASNGQRGQVFYPFEHVGVGGEKLH
jgi:hypothetical protein